MTYKYFGLIATLILLCGLYSVIKKWPQNKHLTFSQHVAKHKTAIIYYALLFSVVLPLLLLFFINWFVPTFNVSTSFDVLVVGSSAAQYVCVLIPEVGGWKSNWHRLFAGLSALLLVPAGLFLLTSSKITVISKFVVAIGLLIMVIVIYMVTKTKGKPNNFLIYQTVYFIAFFVPVLFISYLQ